MKGNNPLKPAERLKILRQEMPERPTRRAPTTSAR
jgi:hypothetical protein